MREVAHGASSYLWAVITSTDVEAQALGLQSVAKALAFGID